MEINMTFSEKLVILRKKYGLTQDDLAKQLGVSRQSVYKWECGQSYPEVPKLLEIKLHFNVKIDDLLDDSYEMPMPEKKKKKRLSKETIKRIEESIKAEIGFVEVAAVATAADMPEKNEVEAVAEEEKEPVAVAAEVVEAVSSAEPVEEVKAPAVEPAPAAEEKTAKKVGFFGKLFGKR